MQIKNRKKRQKEEVNLVEKFFYFHGVELSNVGTQLVGDCPFCDGTHKLHADDESAQWDCKSCGESGNAFTFMEKVLEAGMDETDYTALSVAVRAHRKKKAEWTEQTLPSKVHMAKALERVNWCFHPFRQNQLIAPIFAPHKKSVDDPAEAMSFYVANLRIYDLSSLQARFCSTPKIHKTESRQHPWVNAAFITNPNPHAIWITEGEWDAILLDYVLNGVDRNDDPTKHPYWVLGTAGGSISLNLTSFRRVGLKASGGSIPIVCLGDNDKAGTRTAKDLSESLTNEFDAKVSVFCWPEDTPQGYDFTDAVANPESPFRDSLPEDGGPGKKLKLAMRTLIDAAPKLDLTREGHDEPDPELEPATYDEVLQGFKKLGVHLTDTVRELLWLAGACVVSSQRPGVPLWLFGIAPPGSSKSLVLSSFASLRQTYYQTSLNKKTMVSGYNSGGGDPSLLAQLVNPSKTLVVQDWTTIMDMPQTYRVELSALLREAFDGSINQKFANGPHRVYQGQFGIVAGVTPKIHQTQEADVGARFLKREWRESLDTARKVMKKALTSSDGSLESSSNVNERRMLVRRWIEPYAIAAANTLEDDLLPGFTEEEEEDLISLSYWVAVTRAVIHRDRVDGAPLYRASTETPTRTIKQLGRYVQYLQLIRPDADRQEVLSLVASLAWDTGWTRKADCLLALAVEPERTPREIASQLRLPKTTTERAFHDLEELDVVTYRKKKKTPRPGRSDNVYRLSEWFQSHADRVIPYFT